MEMYRVRAFAQLAGVTVRTLHHYDRLRVLCPRGRSGSGHRLYALADLERLEQIIALKYLGFSLCQIGQLLGARAPRLDVALGIQRELLREKQGQIECALQAIERAIQAPGTEGVRVVIASLTKPGQDLNRWTEKYYSAGAKMKIQARRPQFTPAMQVEVSARWAELTAEVERQLTADPASSVAQRLLRRWTALVEEFTQGDGEIQAGLQRTWADRANWPKDMRQKTAGFRPEVMAFIARAREAAGRA